MCRNMTTKPRVTALKARFEKTWRALPANYDRLFLESGFERGMSALAEDGYPPLSQLMTDMGHYFATFRLRPGNLYTALACVMSNLGLGGRTVFGSLNYDTLLEAAIAELFGGCCNYAFSGWPPEEMFPCVLKLHGSCNFFPEGPTFKDCSFTGAATWISTSHITTMSPDETLRVYRENSALPVLSFYAPDKRVMVGPQRVNESRVLWAEWARGADMIVTLGVRPLLEDEHVWRPIRESNAVVLFIGGRDAGYGQLANELKEKLVYLCMKFGDAMPELIVRLTAFSRT